MPRIFSLSMVLAAIILISPISFLNGSSTTEGSSDNSSKGLDPMDLSEWLMDLDGSKVTASRGLFSIGSVRVDLDAMEVLEDLPDDGFRNNQFLIRVDRNIISHDTLVPEGMRILDILGPMIFLVEIDEDLDYPGSSLLERFDHTRYHSLMVLDPWILEELAEYPAEREHQVVLGSYDIWNEDMIGSVSEISSIPPMRIGNYELLSFLDVRSISFMLNLGFISHVSPLMPEDLDNDIAADIMDVTETWDTLGLNGTGQIVAVADTGLDTGVNSTMHSDFDGRIRSAYAYGRTGNWSDPDIHVWDSSSGSWSYKGGHGTHVAGSAVGDGSASSGDYSGMAPEAEIVFQSTMKSSGSLSIPAYSILFGDAYNSGARIHTNSWSSRSNYANYTWKSWQIDHFIWNHDDMTVLFSAGNKGTDGQYSVSTQSSSKNVISVGASENYRPSVSSSANNISQMAYFSSQGYTWGDGRIKPDVVAPGTYILSTRASTISDFWNHYWGSNSTYVGVNSKYAYMGGTSMSTPLVAGMSTLIRQYFEDEMGVDDPSASLIKAAVINGARPLNGDWSSIPNRYEGWGRVNLSNSLGTSDSDAGDLFFIENETGLTTGDSYTEMIEVSGNGKDLIATLVWTDYPGSNSSSTKLLNDLDLVVTDPYGNRYFGNDLVSPFDSTRDRNNNVERVRIQLPGPGLYNVTIKGHSVTKGPQSFSLVGTFAKVSSHGFIGSVVDPIPSNGTSIRLFLTDLNQSGKGSVSMKVNSSTDPTGETLTLTEELLDGEGTGIFFGDMKFTQNSPGAGEVQVTGDEVIRLFHQEVYPKRDLTSDIQTLKTPEIFNVTVDPGDEILTYTDEFIIEIDATSGQDVHYGIPGISGLEWVKAHDDGMVPDRISGDGIYTANGTIPDSIIGNFTLISYVRREGLEPVVNISQDRIMVNTDLPIRPFGLTISSTDIGNSLLVSWNTLHGGSVENFTIYRNDVEDGIHWTIDDYSVAGRTMDNSTTFVDEGLIDGKEYFYRISSTNIDGLNSRLSEAASGVPYDLTSPGVIWSGPKNGEVLSREVDLDILLSNDTISFTLQGSLDPDGDGTPNGIWMDLEQWNYPDLYSSWNTSSLSSVVWEGKPVLLRLKIRDEAGNQNITEVMTSVWVDNTPPSILELDTPTLSIQGKEHFEISGSTEKGSIVELYSEDGLLETQVSGSSGEFLFERVLRSGENGFNLKVFDEHMNGPLLNDEDIIVIFDDIAPVPVIYWTDNDTSKKTNFHGDLSHDPGPESILTGISEYYWNISKGDDLWLFTSSHITFDAGSPGTYLVTLLVVDNGGNEQEFTEYVEIHDGIVPVIRPFDNIAVNEDSPLDVVPDIIDDDPRIQETGIFRWYDIATGETISESLILDIEPEDPGLYHIGFSVTDTGGNEATSSFELRVLDVTSPEVEAGSDREIVWGGEVSLWSNGTYDNSGQLEQNGRFIWKIEDLGVEIRDNNGSFKALKLGIFEVVLTVYDGSGNIGTDSFILTITNDKEAPYILDSNPGSGSMDHEQGDEIWIRFSESMDVSLAWKWISLSDGDGTRLKIYTSWMDGDTRLSITTEEDLIPGRYYNIEIDNDMTDISGTPFPGDSIEFRIADSLILDDVIHDENIVFTDAYHVIRYPASIHLIFNYELDGAGDVEVIESSSRRSVATIQLGEDGILYIPDDLDGGEYFIDLSGLRSEHGDEIKPGNSGQITVVISRDEGENGLPLWLIFVISFIILIVIGGIAAALIYLKNRGRSGGNVQDHGNPGSDTFEGDKVSSNGIKGDFYPPTGNQK